MSGRTWATAAVVSLLLADAAAAAPLCVVVEGFADSCIYADPRSCQADALRRQGICAANPAELRVTGTAPFCLVDSSLTVRCDFADRATCFRVAARNAGACLVARASLAQSLDPFLVKRP
jgi:hypothetical protein